MKSKFCPILYVPSAGPVTPERVGPVVSTRTPVVFGGVKLKEAFKPALSLIVPPFKTIGDADVMPSVSVSPAWTVYLKVSALVPLPET